MPSIQQLLEGLPNEYHYAVIENRRLEQRGLFDMDTSADEDKDYRQWAREEYQPEQMIDPTWHPVIVEECVKIIKEFIAD